LIELNCPGLIGHEGYDYFGARAIPQSRCRARGGLSPTP
jgi:hypothetical protein